ncbi:MAG: hypothetical protein DMG68_22295 [Acidobacteria bacterium]|nr:MAG: hypothetical protein DMG68_22295 [Acidobacteriota bacterium]
MTLRADSSAEQTTVFITAPETFPCYPVGPPRRCSSLKSTEDFYAPILACFHPPVRPLLLFLILKVLTNHLGYEAVGPKHAVILGKADDKITGCTLKNNANDQPVVTVPAQAVGSVKKWRDWSFWTADFDNLAVEGTYYLECATNQGAIRSFPFAIQKHLLGRNTISDVLYYLKDERSSGPMDEADRHLHFDGKKAGTLDAHGGWWDATGDYGKHLSHLSFSTYFNPPQIPLVIYSLFKSRELLDRSGAPEFRRYKDRMLDEAIFGADYLVRVKDPAASF